jgi:hypothetical protein
MVMENKNPARPKAFEAWERGYNDGMAGKPESSGESRRYTLGWCEGDAALDTVMNSECDAGGRAL